MLERKQALTLLGGIATILVAVYQFGHVSVFAQAEVSATKKLEALRVERRDILKQRLDAFESLESNPQGSFESTFDARDDYLDAELELNTEKHRRIALLQLKLENSKKREALMDSRVQAARGLKTDVLQATARRLTVEIDLLRESE